MAQVQMKQFSFTYAGATDAALQGIDFSVEEGAFILLCGPSGSGKTTLLRQLKQEIAPAGKWSGLLSYEGAPLTALAPARAASEIGYVFQDPENQLVMDTVRQELAFALENMGCSVRQMHQRIGELVHFFGMESWLDRPLHELSGGQKQMVSLAAVLLLQPRLLLLDEPTAQLDPVAATELLQLIARINEEFGTTILLSEHRLESIFPLVDQVLLMDEGRIRYQGTPQAISAEIWHQQDERWFQYLPSLCRWYLRASQGAPRTVGDELDLDAIPLTVRAGRRWLAGQPAIARGSELPEKKRTKQGKQKGQRARAVAETASGRALLRCSQLSFQYEQGGRRIVNRLDCLVEPGQILAIVGGNGAGKSTLLRLMLGLLKPQAGGVYCGKRPVLKLKEAERMEWLGYLAQHPSIYFMHETVGGALQQRAKQLSLVDPQGAIDALLQQLALARACLQQHPYDLSGGELQKAALALILLADPRVLLLDEPTKGLDPWSKQRLGQLLQQWQQAGKGVVLVSHDLEFVATMATHCTLLFDGRLTEAVSPQDFFTANHFYTTMLQRVVRDVLPDVITYQDVMEKWPTLHP